MSIFLQEQWLRLNGRRNSVTHALAKGIMVHLGLDSAREGCVRVFINAQTTSIKQKLQQDCRTSLILRVDHVSSKRKWNRRTEDMLFLSFIFLFLFSRVKKRKLRGLRWKRRIWLEPGITWRLEQKWRARPLKWCRNAVSRAAADQQKLQ